MRLGLSLKNKVRVAEQRERAAIQHTKGPWETCGSTIRTHLRPPEERTSAEHAGVEVATVALWWPSAQVAANAALIAAAPELAQVLLNWVEATTLDEHPGAVRPVYRAACAALKKAGVLR